LDGWGNLSERRWCGANFSSISADQVTFAAALLQPKTLQAG
jgi:hypothetical protein